MCFRIKFWKKKKIELANRSVRANDPEYNAKFEYNNNYISTCKYNVFTFLPCNLFEQFSRTANIYFVVLLILQLIPQISSLSYITTVVPLVLVILISMLKDASDDIQRFLSDKKVNNRTTKVLRGGVLEETSWSKVVVGDIIRLESNQFVTADLILLSTSQVSGLCYVETSELDGETNLKVKEAVQDTSEMADDLSILSRFTGEVTCEKPNNVLSRFEGMMECYGVKTSLDNDKVLLRGCKVRNTAWCFGLVIFAGKESKLMMNSGITKFKRTHIDRLMNTLILGIFVLLISMGLVCSIGAGFWEANFGTDFQVYLPWDSYVPGSVLTGDSSKSYAGATVTALLVFFSYIIVLNTVVPISLYVSVEILRLGNSWLINWDQLMYHKESNTPARSRTTTLNEELGQIEYIFSDKTGTLTQNVMTFNKCSIDCISYGDYTYQGRPVDITEVTPKVDFTANPYSEPNFTFYDQKLLKAVNDKNEQVAEFFRLLALCHTVISDEKEGRLLYEAQSPDENALVGAARNFGFVFKNRSPTSITINVLGTEETYEQLCILDFNNVRKRMSIIVRKDGKIKLLCKGADSTIYERLDKSDKRLQDQTKKHFEMYAQDGLRTLCLASKDIEADHYKEWKKKHHAASISLEDRDDKMSAVYEEIEIDMQLIGATGVEDKLQDGVPETIANLLLADIKMWVLTGDKPETAVNIGYSCHLLTEEMGSHLYVIEEESDKVLTKQQKSDAVKEQLVRAYTSMNEALIGQNNHMLGRTNEGMGLSEDNLSGSNEAFLDSDNHKNNRPDGSAIGSLSTKNSHTSYETNSNYHHNNSTSTYNAKHFDPFKQLEFGLVIDGGSLMHALHPDLEKLFLETGCLCKSVICCRVTPLQKAQVVQLVKKNKQSVTLSIGDGANDVSMIKKAHIGVGISGQEGMQAVLASDYSIAQFRYLERLLLVHGRWSYMRMCKFLKYFFYKNFAFTLCHFWFAFFSGFSAQTLYDQTLISIYNVVFTSLPVIMLGVFDQDLSAKVSLQYPKLYTPGHLNYFFNKKVFAQSLLEGVLTSLLLYFLSYGAYQDSVTAGGKDIAGMRAFGVSVTSSLIFTVTLRCSLETYLWTSFNIASFVISIVAYFVYELIFHVAFKGTYYGTDLVLWRTANYWLTLLLTVVVILLSAITEKYYFIDTRPTLVDKLRQQSSGRTFKAKKGRTRVLRRASTMRKSTRSVGRSGYAFSHEEGFGDLITSGALMRKSRKDNVGETNGNVSLEGFTGIGSFRGRKFATIAEEGKEEPLPANNTAPKANSQTPSSKPHRPEPNKETDSEPGTNHFSNSKLIFDKQQTLEEENDGVINRAFEHSTLDKLKQRQQQLVENQLTQEIPQPTLPQTQPNEFQRQPTTPRESVEQACTSIPPSMSNASLKRESRVI